ncbi:hypothetical protein AURDEDRAFT_133760 [Auricularia subglabra TFB-10046 SS5]|nr:hypothetical protein AURDEDRAFT_133760 [Auricularia subglabra TFB-10046 SS5]
MDTPLNKAHAHAVNAEDFRARGLLVKASEEHYRAAELFKKAMETSSAEGTKRTLRMLYTEHNNSGKELQRKIAELEAQGKDPSVPQLPQQSRRSPPSSTAHSPSYIMSQLPGSGQHQYPPASFSRTSSASRLGESQLPFGESYMVLDGQHSDAADPFKDFWENVEAMLDRFSSPLAFATAPLSPPSLRHSQLQSVSSGSDSSDAEDGLSPRVADKDQVQIRESLADALSDQVAQITLNDSLSSTLRPKSKPAPTFHIAGDFDDDDSSSDGFFVIPEEPNLRSLQEENAQLKERLKATEAKLAAAEKHMKDRAAQEQQLRDGLLSARAQMQQRLGASSILPQPIVDMSFPNLKLPTVPGLAPLPAPVPAPTQNRETMLIRRTRELEDELRVTREENEKQRTQIAKFRERWAKLKESAKRKKSARAAAEAGRIDEEPEREEEEADKS